MSQFLAHSSIRRTSDLHGHLLVPYRHETAAVVRVVHSHIRNDDFGGVS